MNIRQKIKSLLNKKWYFQGFNGTPALLYGSTRSTVNAMPKTLGYGYGGIIFFFEGDKCYYLYAWEDLYSILKRLRANFRKDGNYLKFLLKKDKEFCDKALAYYRKVDRMDLSKKSDRELSEIFKEVDNRYEYVLAVSHIVEGFTLTTENKIRELVEKHAGEKGNESLKILAAPLWHSFMSIEQNDLCRIVREIKKMGLKIISTSSLGKYPEIYEKIRKHQNKYYWKNNGYASSKVLAVDDFIREIDEIMKKDIDIGKKIKEFGEIKNNKKRKEKLLKEYNDKELTELITINDVIFRLHDHRKECMTISLTYVDMLLAEMGKRKRIPIELMRYIKTEEFPNVASIRNELEERRKRCVFITLKQGSYVLKGKEAEDYIKILKEQIRTQGADIIKGSCASRGKAKGIVKVCRGEKEIAKMEKGRILVACMTQPEFLPAMKKAIAIITDEGGLTCHAAIISRELGIPCVIGTKTATQVLKDGDLVEVDADKGIVRKIREVKNGKEPERAD